MNPPEGEAFPPPLKDLGTGACDPLVALQRGDPEPFEAFAKSHSRRFLGFFDRLGAARSESEDLVQETFLKLFRLAAQSNPAPGSAPGPDPSPIGSGSGSAMEAADRAKGAPKGETQAGTTYHDRGQFLAYAFRVARNVWIDRTRRRASAPGRTEDDASELPISIDARRPNRSTPAPGAAAEVRDEADRIREAIAALPESHRLVFELGVLQELPYAEIAHALDIPVGTVKSRMFNAHRRIKASLVDADEARELMNKRRHSESLSRTPRPRGQAS